MSFKKTILTFILTVFLGSVFFIPATAQAASLYKTSQDCNTGGKEFVMPVKNAIRLQIPIPGVTETTKAFRQELDGASIKCKEKSVYYIKDLQTYIKKVYTFFIGAIALSAIVMMMIGGFQYVLAAGNESRITTSKQIISGALGGLILSLFSFVLLNTINPRITNLEIKNISDTSRINVFRDDICKNLPTGTKVIANSVSTVTITRGVENLKLTCGGKFDIKDSNDPNNPAQVAQCIGTFCPSRSVCINKDKRALINKLYFTPSCLPGFVGGNIKFEVDAFIDNNIELWAVCNNGKREKLFADDLPGPSSQFWYVLPTPETIDYNRLQYACANKTGLKGYYIQVQINDQENLLRTGVDDDYALDRTCKIPISTAKPKEIDWNNVPATRLITLAELTAGFECNIEITRSEFPDRN